ncbi:hypothetical protein SAMN05216360_113104 [Methylobacterium phyllostachyos]|uniref:Uncharacterized protein n=1 Tax=Methylobacterium phyllostachyos TaxID=582672 RepID=A0A1H0FUE6_9HYPH|nr:hypothetical protein [Methylobacterium phyllostachyos]SDN98298.1 hypothetical protein SAMN05216360_113104 [Methylobacterium phyllostachyos]
MRAAELVQSNFEEERAALTARIQFCGGRQARYAVFDDLVSLEDRALAAGAPAVTLRKIAEVRFLAGILRDAVRPRPVPSLRTLLRAYESTKARQHAAVTVREA